jgi:3-oxoacyl-[acyl-carrier-protein] synthase-1
MFVVAAGMTTCVGSDFAGSCAALRCRLCGFEDIPYRDLQDAPIVGAPVRYVSSLRKGRPRLADLAAPALQECLGNLGCIDVRTVPLLLATAEPKHTPSWPAARGDRLLRDLEAALGVEFSPHSRVLRGGSCAASTALSTARELMGKGLAPCCVVGGVDSLIDQGRLRDLELQKRLKIDSDQDGLVPGEAAVLLLCAPQPVEGQTCVRVAGVAAATAADAPRGETLAKVIRGALADAGRRSSDIAVLVTDLTGERDLSMEYTLALTRVFSEPQDWLHIWHLAMSLGTVGAASLPASVGWLLAAGRRGYAPGSHAVCITMADPDRHAATVLSLED